MGESAEQILARLERYAASQRRPELSLREDLLRVFWGTAGRALAVFGCAVVILAFEHLRATPAGVATAAAAFAGLFAMAFRVPFSVWWTFGVATGAALIAIA